MAALGVFVGVHSQASRPHKDVCAKENGRDGQRRRRLSRRRTFIDFSYESTCGRWIGSIKLGRRRGSNFTTNAPGIC